MQSKSSPGRHRKPSPARAVAARTAITAGGAVAAVLLAGTTATAAPAAADTRAPAVAELSPAAEPPCTGTALDAIVGPLSGADCNSNPDDEAPDEGETGPGMDPGSTPPGTDPGTTPPPPGGSIEAEEPPAPGGAALPIPCTGYPIDAFTTCATGGHNDSGAGDRGDAVGSDTPSYGGNDEGGNPPAE